MSSIRDRYAIDTLRNYHHRIAKDRPLPQGRAPVERLGGLTIGIIGAGGAGLYAAMIIESLEDPTITCEILEANEKRVGGRLWTHFFSEPHDPSNNDYYDVGAMRFPKIPFMRRTFDLLDLLNIKVENKLRIPYVMSIGSNINYYNGIIKTNAELDPKVAPADPFNTGVNIIGSAGSMVDAALGSFKNNLKNDFDSGWETLMKYDQWSTRDYMAYSMVPPYTPDQIDYLETVNSATNLYDCALTESVMDSLDFDYAENVDWWCIQGGTSLIANKMRDALKQTKILQGARVTAIAPVASTDQLATSVNLSVFGQEQPSNYSHVISTLPFGCLREVDTTACGLDWKMQTSIRALHYDSSVKVAIKFTSRWWEQRGQKGGVSSTDRPTRTVVYPSYGIGGDQATMIVSYTWAQDALRLGALAQGENSTAEKALIQLILKDLSDMHNFTDYTTLPSMMVAYHVHNWYHDEFSSGAFALFGPSQFKNLYPEVTKPPGGLVHFAGEATSVHHAWLVGALNSAYRAVHEILWHEGRSDLINKMKDIWGTVDEVDDPLVQQQVALGQDMKIQAIKLGS